MRWYYYLGLLSCGSCHGFNRNGFNRNGVQSTNVVSKQLVSKQPLLTTPQLVQEALNGGETSNKLAVLSTQQKTSTAEENERGSSTSAAAENTSSTKEENSSLQTRLSHKMVGLEMKIDGLYSQLNGVSMNSTNASFLAEDFRSSLNRARGSSNVVLVNQFNNSRKLVNLTKRVADTKGEGMNAASKFADSLNATHTMKMDVEKLNAQIKIELSKENKQKVEKQAAVLKALSGNDPDVSVNQMETKIQKEARTANSIGSKLKTEITKTLSKNIRKPLDEARRATRRIGRIETKRWSGMLTNQY